MIPGRTVRLWLAADRPGTYLGVRGVLRSAPLIGTWVARFVLAGDTVGGS